MNQLECPDVVKKIRTFYVWNDFEKDQGDLDWVDTATDSGTVSVGDAANGIMALVASDGTVADNDEAYAATPNELFLVAAGRQLHFMADVQFTEANTDDAN